MGQNDNMVFELEIRPYCSMNKLRLRCDPNFSNPVAEISFLTGILIIYVISIPEPICFVKLFFV
jgi:hypothetical protein